MKALASVSMKKNSDPKNVNMEDEGTAMYDLLAGKSFLANNLERHEEKEFFSEYLLRLKLSS